VKQDTHRAVHKTGEKVERVGEKLQDDHATSSEKTGNRGAP
jgi:hypothetical protein